MGERAARKVAGVGAVEIAEVQDKESLERYLEGLPEDERWRVALRLASLASARVLPIAAKDIAEHAGERIANRPLATVFCAVLISMVVSDLAAREITQHTTSAAMATSSLGRNSRAVFAATATVTFAGTKPGRRDGDPAPEAIEAAADYPIADIWSCVRFDLANSGWVLWPHGMPSDLVAEWHSVKNLLAKETPSDSSFWIAWYDRVLSGRDTYPADLAPIVSKITSVDWYQGPAHLNSMFANVLAMYRADDAAQPLAELTMPPGEAEQIAKTKAAMERHRRELPANFDAILGYIILEIQRLQDRNYRDDADRDESVRQIGVLKTLHQAILRLTMLIPETEDMPQEDAVAAESLARLYVSKFKEWPRANADEMVDNSCRFALVGLSAMTLPMLGVSATVATVAGAAFFGGERILKNIRSAKDAFKPDAG